MYNLEYFSYNSNLKKKKERRSLSLAPSNLKNPKKKKKRKNPYLPNEQINDRIPEGSVM